MIRVKEFIRKTTKETIDSIKNFSVHPFNSLGQLIPVGMLCTSLIGFIVAIIMFAVEGGFSNQIIELKEDFNDLKKVSIKIEKNKIRLK